MTRTDRQLVALAWLISAFALAVSITTIIYTRKKAAERVAVLPVAAANPIPVWRVFEGGVFAPRNGNVPFVNELPPTCEPCDYVHLTMEIPSLYECASTVSYKECREASKKRIAARKAALVEQR